MALLLDAEVGDTCWEMREAVRCLNKLLQHTGKRGFIFFFFFSNPMVFLNLIAWWISDVAIKIVMDEEDNRRTPPHNTSFVKREILEHFQIKDR
jgi:hypothetical protein